MEDKYILSDNEVKALAIDFARMASNRKITHQEIQNMVEGFFNQLDGFWAEIQTQNEARKGPPGEVGVVVLGNR